MDISGIIVDPDFITAFQVVNETEAIGENGRATITTSTADALGTVVPDTESLKRQPDGSRLLGSIKVYTRHPLAPASVGRAADVVLWGGARYTVMAVSNYERWDGLRVASCELADINR